MITHTKGYVCFMKTMSDILFFFETAFQLLNEKYFDSHLPATVVTVQSSPNDLVLYEKDTETLN